MRGYSDGRLRRSYCWRVVRVVRSFFDPFPGITCRVSLGMKEPMPMD